MVRPLLLALVLVLAGAACSKKEPPVPAPLLPAPVASDASLASGSVKSRVADAGARRMTPSEKTAYDDALARGRAATQGKDYAAAVSAFDAALAIVPSAPRALAERGYAHLLAGNLDAAARDFDMAQRVESDLKLDAQIWFNIGLLREKRGQAEPARQAFIKSNLLHSTPAAVARIGVLSSCQAQIEEGAVATGDVGDSYFSPVALRAASWRELASTFSPAYGYDGAGSQLASDDDAKKAFCEDACAGIGPYSKDHYFFQNSFSDDVYPQPKGELLVFHSGILSHAIMGFYCPIPTGSVTSSSTIEGSVLVAVQTTERVPEGCAQASQDAKEPDRCPDCTATEKSETLLYYDVRTAKRLVEITQRYPASAKPRVTATLTGRTLVLTGGRCDRSIDLAALARR